MTLQISRFARPVSTAIAGLMLHSTFLFAADEVVPAPQPPPQTPDNAGRGNRPGRGTVPGGNPAVANQPGGRGGNNFAGGRGAFGGLNLDEKQTELLREAMQADSDELRKLSDKLQAAQKELVTAVIAEKYDETVVRAKADAVAKIQTEITVLRAKAFATVSPTLKPEQRESIENNRAASSLITGAGMMFGAGNVGGPSGPPDQMMLDRNARRGGGGNLPPGGDPAQVRRRGGDRPATPAQ